MLFQQLKNPINPDQIVHKNQTFTPQGFQDYLIPNENQSGITKNIQK